MQNFIIGRSTLRFLACVSIGAVAFAGCIVEETVEDDDGSSTTTSATGSGGGSAGGGGTTSTGGMAASCEGKDGPPEGASGERGPAGLDYDVRIPAGYDATVGHPLLVVYSPAGVTQPLQTEQFTGLTPSAGARGYIVAYVNHTVPDTARFADAGRIPELVAARWCVDSARVYLTGHSDGGTVASVVVLDQLSSLPPAAIAPSAAGVPAGYLAQSGCPPTTPVMVLHSKNDGLFTPPEFGSGAADWWASCATCGAAGAPLANGCVSYEGCGDGVDVQYCEGFGSHGQWPPMNDAMLDFFERFTFPR
jgi:polyhydroxybutyrate depolymerase